MVQITITCLYYLCLSTVLSTLDVTHVIKFPPPPPIFHVGQRSHNKHALGESSGGEPGNEAKAIVCAHAYMQTLQHARQGRTLDYNPIE